MAVENELAVFSLRLPVVLADQINSRAATNGRYRNAEIIMLLQQAIDLNVSRDKLMLEHLRTVKL